MNTYTIPAVDSAVGNSNPAFPRYDGLNNEVPRCTYIRPAYLSSRYDTYNPDGSGSYAAWTFAALAFRQDNLAFLDTKRVLSIRLWLYVVSASPFLHTLSAYCPAGAAFFAGDTSGACAYTLVGWRCFTVQNLAVLKGILQRGVRVDDLGLSTNKALTTNFTAYPHTHATLAPYLEVQYEDEYTPPTCKALEPAATVVDSDGPVTFRWSYAQSVNAPQTHVSLQVRKTGGSWQNILTKHATSAQSYTVQSGIALRGDCQWHVQVFCTSGGVASEWSDAVGFLSTGSPAAPAITGITPTPLCTVTWQQDAQTGFELHLLHADTELWHSGQRLSEDRALTLPMLLETAGYTLRLRTLNAQGRWGPYAAATVRVENPAAGSVQAKCTAAEGGLRLGWTADRDFEAYAVLREGTEIARLAANATEYVDREALGLCRYIVRGLLGRGYVDSPPATGTCSVAHAQIGDAAGGAFIPLELRHDAPPVHRQSRSARVRYVQYEGDPLPTGYAGGAQQRSHTLYFTLENRRHYDALLALVGRQVIYKDREGDVFCGVLDGVTADSGSGLAGYPSSGAAFDTALTLTETREVAP